MNQIFTAIIRWLLLLVFSTRLLAQAPPSPLPQCGTQDLTPQQIRQLVQQGNLALERKRASGAAFTAITYVPIRPHIFRQSNGQGGFTLANLNQAMATTNSYYLLNGYGIQFYFAGTTPDYIDNDNLLNNFPYPEGSAVDGRDAPDALNQYYVNQIANNTAGGYAYYPANGLYSTRSFIGIYNNNQMNYVSNNTIPHELGHNFNLIHTFGSVPTTELVTRGSGANCTTNGDLICDTPADPYNKPGANFINTNGCLQYDPNSTARDANGEAYSPAMSNIMSYYFSCTHDFTPGQYDRMQAALALRQTHTAYSLTAPPTDAPAPSNLRASLNGSQVTLTWQDNATNEMGYFIERSTSPTTGFVPIGGVEPNATTFVDSRATAPNRYYYRVRPSNTTTGSISSVIDMSVSALTATINGNTAVLEWPSAGTGSTYELQWRIVNNPTWNTVSNLTLNRLSLYNLVVNTTYEWRVKTTGTDQYQGPVTFTVPCQAPNYPYAYPARVSAVLTWSTAITGQTYALRWRAKNDPNWTVVSNLGSNGGSYSLTGLQPSTAYEWQVQGVCSPTVSSDFTALQSFTTFSCQAPFSMQTSYTLSSSAYVYWSNQYEEAGRTTELRYRAVGSADWTVISGLTTTAYSFSGLANNTQYEWQLRTICPGGQQSDFTTSNLFTTVCAVPQGLYSSTATTSARLSWYINGNTETGSSFELQYRLASGSEWTTIRDLKTNNYTVTDLTTDVTYEWRVRLVCSANAQSDYSATATFIPRCNPVTLNNAYVSYVTSSSAQFFWYADNEAGTTYEIRYRTLGSSDWTTTVSNLTATNSFGSYTVTNLPNNTTFEWQIRTTCSASVGSVFTTGPNFTTQCRIPASLNSYSSTVSGVSLSWSQIGVDVTYDLRYRRIGTTNWVTLENLTTRSTSLSGLPGNTAYEWQVRTHCADGQYSDYSAMSNFSTSQCLPPGSLFTFNITENAATLSWYTYSVDSDTRSEMRWRVLGSSDWTTVSSLSLVAYNSRSYTLTGLTSSTQYEWQVRTLCSATENSDFSSSIVFQTKAACDQMYTLKSGNWTDTSVWSCGRIPAATDTVHMRHAITIPQNYRAMARNLVYDAAVPVTWQTGSQLVLSPN